MPTNKDTCIGPALRREVGRCWASTFHDMLLHSIRGRGLRLFNTYDAWWNNVQSDDYDNMDIGIIPTLTSARQDEEGDKRPPDARSSTVTTSNTGRDDERGDDAQTGRADTQGGVPTIRHDMCDDVARTGHDDTQNEATTTSTRAAGDDEGDGRRQTDEAGRSKCSRSRATATAHGDKQHDARYGADGRCRRQRSERRETDGRRTPRRQLTQRTNEQDATSKR